MTRSNLHGYLERVKFIKTDRRSVVSGPGGEEEMGSYLLMTTMTT